MGPVSLLMPALPRTRASTSSRPSPSDEDPRTVAAAEWGGAEEGRGVEGMRGGFRSKDGEVVGDRGGRGQESLQKK